MSGKSRGAGGYSSSKYPTTSRIGGLGRVTRSGSGSSQIKRAKLRDSALRRGSGARGRIGRGSAKPRRRLLEGVDQALLAKVVTIAAFCIVGAIGLALILISANSGGRELEMSVIDSAETSGAITVEDAGAEATIAIGGSIKLQDEVLTAAKSGDAYNFNNYLSELKSVMSADISIVNMLGTVGAEPESIKGYPSPAYPTAVAEALKNIGVTHAVTANSYTLANGYDAMVKTNQSLLDNDITPIGTYTSSATGNEVYVKRVNSILIGIAAYNCLSESAYNDLQEAQAAAGVTGEKLSYCINQLKFGADEACDGAEKVIKEDIEAMRQAGAQFIIVCFNWCSADSTNKTSAMGTMASRMANNGVDAIVGYGSDVVQTVKLLDGKDASGNKKKAYLFYSMGNLFSDVDSGESQSKRESLVIRLTLERKSGSSAATLKSAEYHPIYINRDETNTTPETSYLKYRVVPALVYTNADKLPEAFSNESQWNKCKKAYNNIKALIDGESSAKSAFSMGTLPSQEAQSNAGDGENDTGENNSL